MSLIQVKEELCDCMSAMSAVCESALSKHIAVRLRVADGSLAALTGGAASPRSEYLHMQAAAQFHSPDIFIHRTFMYASP